MSASRDGMKCYTVEGRDIIARNISHACDLYRENFGGPRRRLEVKQLVSGFTLAYVDQPPFEVSEEEFVRRVEVYGGNELGGGVVCDDFG